MVKNSNDPWVVLAVHDYYSARIAAEAQVDYLLVGDSLAMTALGLTTTVAVTWQDMLRHAAAVIRGAGEVPVVVDLPAEAAADVSTALVAARDLRTSLGCSNLKIEGRPDLVRALTEAGFRIWGHVGLKPQTAAVMKVQGRSDGGQEVLREALAVEAAGAVALVVECVPEKLGEQINDAVEIRTIGIGAGRRMGGQVLVFADVVGLFPPHNHPPKFLRVYAAAYQDMTLAVENFRADVLAGKYPADSEIYF